MKEGNTILKLNPWPFDKGEEVLLYWLCSPFQNPEGLWILTAVFKRLSAQEFVKVEYPWGTLPLLSLGRIYKDKLMQQNTVSNYEMNIDIKSSLCNIETAWNIPSILWSMNRNKQLGKQLIYKFVSNNITYYIPTLELIRAYFASNVALTNQILQPNGLDFWVVSEKSENQALYIDFSADMPRSMLNNSMVQFLVWLRHDSQVKVAWQSVYSNLLGEAVKLNREKPAQQLQFGIPLQVNPSDFSKWSFRLRGYKQGTHCLVLEITEVAISAVPFKQIFYSHPSLIENAVGTPENTMEYERRKRVPNSEHELDESGLAGTPEANPEKLNQFKMKYSFAGRPQMIAIRQSVESKNQKKYNQSEKLIILPPDVTTQDQQSGGKIRSIEVEEPLFKYGEWTKGLEEFFQGLEKLQDLMPKLDILIDIVSLTSGTFACLSDGSQRKCAIVKIINNGQWCGTLIEVARPDKWEISTLLMLPKTSDYSLNEPGNMVDSLITSLDGHWDLEKLVAEERFEFFMFRHSGCFNVKGWSKRVKNKLRLER